MHVHAAELGAAMQRRKHLAGVEQAVGVEGASVSVERAREPRSLSATSLSPL